MNGADDTFQWEEEDQRRIRPGGGRSIVLLATLTLEVWNVYWRGPLMSEIEKQIDTSSSGKSSLKSGTGQKHISRE